MLRILVVCCIAAGLPLFSWDPIIVVEAAAADVNSLPLLFSEDFENGVDRWEIFDSKSWRLAERKDNTTFEITTTESEYAPQVRSPKHIALIKDLYVDDFVLEFKVRSTRDTGNHRDCCVFFSFGDRTHFYYVHLGAQPDPASGQIMVVDNGPRRPLTKNERRTPWDDSWHAVRLTHEVKSGRIKIYFDDMTKPHMETQDATFRGGRLGIGSFDDLNEFDDLRVYGNRSAK